MTQRGPLDGPLETLTDALRKHAAVLTASAEPAVVVPAINEVRAAALAYITAVFDESGWATSSRICSTTRTMRTSTTTGSWSRTASSG